MDTKALANLPEVQAVEAELEQVYNAAIEVNNAQQASEAAALLQRIRQAARRIEEVRTSITAPLNASLRAINAFFKGPTEALTERQKAVTRALQQWQAAERERVEQERRQAQEAADAERARLARIAEANRRMGAAEVAAETERQAVAVQAAPVIRAQSVAGFHERSVWDFEVVVAAVLPREYMRPDDAKLGELARTSKGQAVVPGVRFYERKIGVVR